jgi:hypothetical protein
MNDWKENTGSMPVKYGTLVDVRHRDGEEYHNVPAGDPAGPWAHEWSFCDEEEEFEGDIMYWRINEDSTG